jgi:hypothetical protein
MVKTKEKIAEHQTKIAECQAKLRELERQKTKLENFEIVSMFRNNSEKWSEDIFAMLREGSQIESGTMETSKVENKEEQPNGTYEN